MSIFNKNKLNYDCFNCIDDNKDLYYEDIDKDMELSNNCKRITTIKTMKLYNKWVKLIIIEK